MVFNLQHHTSSLNLVYFIPSHNLLLQDTGHHNRNDYPFYFLRISGAVSIYIISKVNAFLGRYKKPAKIKKFSDSAPMLLRSACFLLRNLNPGQQQDYCGALGLQIISMVFKNKGFSLESRM